MLHHVWHRLQQLEKEISKLKKENQELKEKISQIKPIQIDKIIYKIQELQVETLSGTLNVGLSAVTDPQKMHELFEEIIKEKKMEVDLGNEEQTET